MPSAEPPSSVASGLPQFQILRRMVFVRQNTPGADRRDFLALPGDDTNLITNPALKPPPLNATDDDLALLAKDGYVAVSVDRRTQQKRIAILPNGVEAIRKAVEHGLFDE